MNAGRRRVAVVETHLSWVLLAGPWAYKVKKPVNLGFADFSTLARRRHCCKLELRLNRRLAPQLYRDVVAITRGPRGPRLGGPGPAFEYAVRMVRFPQAQLAARQLRAGRLAARHIDALALDLAAFHRRAARAGAGRGALAAARAAARQNFAQLRELPGLGAQSRSVAALRRWSERRFAALAPRLRRRQRAGRVRECHGDLHLGNMVLLGDRLVMFDCLEFNPALRWIDTASEIAFVVMDLLHRGAGAFAHRFLDRYLEASGDYEALEVLDLFLVYRALVRAKVAAIRAAQCAPGSAPRAAAQAEARGYIGLARSFTRRRPQALLITCGLSGSGKTTLTTALVDATGMIRVRSDVERKRLLGLAPADRTGAGVGRGPYSAAATARTYAVLRRRADRILHAGYSAVVDASFLRRAQRRPFARLARRRGCAFRVITCQAPAALLRRRIRRRTGDASEATPAVLARQIRRCQPPSAGEAARTIVLDTRTAGAGRRLLRSLAARPD